MKTFNRILGKSIVAFTAYVVMASFVRAEIVSVAEWVESTPTVCFESADWAEGALADATADNSVVIEGGRLRTNTTWSSDKAHLVFNAVYVPDGVTLTVTAGAGVKFCEGTFIKVEDGGKMEIIGADGADVVLDGSNAEECIRLQSSAATLSDNGWMETRGFDYVAFPSISVNDTVAVRNGGMAYVTLTLSGSARTTAFSVDWEAVADTASEGEDYLLSSGTISWTGTSQGTKTLAIPLNAANVTGEERTFTLKIVTARCANIAHGEATVRIVERDAFMLEWADEWTESDPPIYLGEGLPEVDEETTVIEGGRLLANTMWDSVKTHLVANSVYVARGVTLTITQGARVEFEEGTFIKVEDGGKLEIVGADGADVVLDGSKSADCIRLQSNAATFTDNGWLQTKGFDYGAYPTVNLNDVVAFRSSGLAIVPVTISGTRNQNLSIDWVAVDGTAASGVDYTLAAGRVSWAKASDGTKTIEIPLVKDRVVGEITAFTVKIAAARGANVGMGEATVEIRELDRLPLEWGVAENDPPIYFGAGLPEVDEETTAIEGGRLLANTMWDSVKTHLVANSVYVARGVTLTITQGARVEFGEGTFIKVEDGGKLEIVGADGADVVLDGSKSADCIRLQSSAATFTDNGWLQTKGFDYAAYPTVTVHEATASRAEGKVCLAVTVAGSARNQGFTVDWIAEDDSALFGRDYTATRGRLTWSKSGDGTKYIEIPLVKEASGEARTFTVKLSAARGVNVDVGSATVTIAEFGDCGITGGVEFADSGFSAAFTIDEPIGRQPVFLSESVDVWYSGAWQTYDRARAAAIKVLVENDNSSRLLKEAPIDSSGHFDFDVSGLDIGHWSLKHEIVDSAGVALAVMAKDFSVIDDSIEMHGGTLTQTETWNADRVHVVYEPVFVPAQYTLFIEPGTVVKFFTGAGITIEAGGGALFADQIVFTHINDDTVGGDTLYDGYAGVPPMDAYSLDGNFTFGDDVELRNLTQDVALTGTIAGSRTLSRASTYRVSGTVTVANGGTLTIPPGTVLKMEAGASILVNSGGTLNARGTRAAPIVITSIKDDEHGGDTNKDGDATLPQPGDWIKIGINGGVANFEFAKLLYASKNQATGAINMNGGSVSFCNGEIAHGLYDAVGVESGTFAMTNSVIHDCLQAFRHWARDPIVNCVIYDCGRLTQGGGQTFVNCVFTEIAEAWEAFGFPRNTTYRNCCFWNEGGSVLSAEGEQDALTVCGMDGNVWGNPCFADAANGDFRILAGSPCVDAGDGAVAPEKDFYGQPRVGSADIGISEFQLRGGSSDVDLMPVAVHVEGAVAPGQLVFVRWEDINAGSGVIVEPWRDTLSLVNSAGQHVALGDKITLNKVGGGGTVFCSGYFTVPAIDEGEWFVKLNVNSYHDVFEGTLTENNTLISTDSITVSLSAISAANGSVAGVMGAGVPKVVKLAFGVEDENRMVRLKLDEGVSVRYGFGFVPSAGNATGEIRSAGHDVLIKAPEGERIIYLTLEGDRTLEYELAFESSDMQIVAVSQATLPKSGNVTFTITGAGFENVGSVTLTSGGGQVPVERFTVVDAQTIVATVDCAKLALGACGLSVASGDSSATLPAAVTVEDVEGKGEFWARLVVPASVRQGRKAICSVEYGNSGNADVGAQVMQVSIEGDGMLFYADETDALSLLKFLAIGRKENAGCVCPDHYGRIKFVLQGGASNKMLLRVGSANDGELSFAEMPEVLQRMTDWGCDATKYLQVMNAARTISDNLGAYAIAGKILGESGSPCKNVSIAFIQRDVDDPVCISTISDTHGLFVAYGATNGIYDVIVQGKTICMGAEAVVVDNGDVAGKTITVDDKLSFIVQAEDVLVDEEIEFAVATTKEDEVVYGAVATDEGLAFVGLPDGFYEIYVRTTAGRIARKVVALPRSVGEKISLALQGVGTISGEFAAFTADDSAGVLLLSSEGDVVFSGADENGLFCLDELQPDSYTLIVLSSQNRYQGVTNFVLAASEQMTFSFGRNESQMLYSLTVPSRGAMILANSAWSDFWDNYNAIDNGRDALEMHKAHIEDCKSKLLAYWNRPMYDACCREAEKRELHALISCLLDVYAGDIQCLAVAIAMAEQGTHSSLLSNLYDFSKEFAFAMEKMAEFRFGGTGKAKFLSAVAESVDKALGFSERLLSGYNMPEAVAYSAIEIDQLMEDLRALVGSLDRFTSMELDSVSALKEVLTIVQKSVSAYGKVIGLAKIVSKGDPQQHPELVMLAKGVVAIDDALGKYRHLMDSIGHAAGSILALERVGTDSTFADWGRLRDEIRRNMHLLDSIAENIDDGLSRLGSDCGCPACGTEDCKCVHLGEIADAATPAVPRSIDPNEMAGPKGIAKLQYVEVGNYLEYTVYFENKSDATAAAQEVRVTNPLSEYLDWNSFEIVETAFNNQVDLGLSGKSGGSSEVALDGTNYKVRSEVAFDGKTGVIECYIRIVDESTESTWPEDVYAGFLPPNDETKCGEGHFTYRVKLREDAPAWEIVTNSASIVFDYNEAIETEPSWWNSVLVPLSMNDILNADNVYFANDEIAPWDMDLDESCADDDKVSYRSGVIFDGESTVIAMPVKGPGTLSFWWRCSAEYKSEDGSNIPLDYGYVMLDGNRAQVEIYGWEREWTNRTVKVEGDGEHMVCWVYSKNDADVGDVGEDSLWIDGVSWVSDWPSVTGDRDAQIDKNPDGTFRVVPSVDATNLFIRMPDVVDPSLVTVAVQTSVESFALNGAKAQIRKGDVDLTPYLEIPAPDADGCTRMSQVAVKREIAVEALDAAKGAEIDLGDPAAPTLTTAATKPGLTYTLREGTTLEDMSDGDSTVGDGQPWTPNITVKGGTSGFYSIKVEK